MGLIIKSKITRLKSKKEKVFSINNKLFKSS